MNKVIDSIPANEDSQSRNSARGDEDQQRDDKIKSILNGSYNRYQRSNSRLKNNELHEERSNSQLHTIVEDSARHIDSSEKNLDNKENRGSMVYEIEEEDETY